MEATDEETVRKVKQLLDTDRRLTYDELAYDLGISPGSVYAIMKDKLNMRRVTARWVPHCLSDDQNERAPLWYKYY